MIAAPAFQFHLYLLCLGANLALNSVLNVKALAGTFNQENALVGAFSVITNICVDLLGCYIES